MIRDDFAGAGGWDEGLRMLGVTERVVGIEWDRDACRTGVAAGHVRVRADITTLPSFPLDGYIASPPCTKFSTAGAGIGRGFLAALCGEVRRVLAGEVSGDDARAALLGLIEPLALGERRAANHARRRPWSQARVAKSARSDAVATALVVEPARVIRESSPSWVAMEQVPQVLPIWQAYADGLRALGWSAWCGVLDAADYGVPQNRRRAILIAHRDRGVTRPWPTHARDADGHLLGARPWVTMGEALGLGCDGVAARPAATISSGGADTGGAEPFANVGYRSAFARIVTNQAPQGGSERYSCEIDRPSPTLTTNVRLWTFVNGTQANAARRASDEPAPTIHFGNRANYVHWAHERPATTVVASYRPDIIAGPGYRTSTSRQDAPDSVRVTVEQAATFQGFPLGYPWRGSKTSQYRQVGNAIPPALAAHTLAALGVGDPTRLETAA